MAEENSIYVIAGSEHEIWAIDPRSRQKLRIKLSKDKSKIFDIYASGSGIYHATELVKPENKIVGKYERTFNVNYVQVFDSISGKSLITITPPGTFEKPLEQRVVSIDFDFVRKDGSLLYSLNGYEGTLFPHCNIEETSQSGNAYPDGKDVFFGNRRIASLDEKVTYAREIDAKEFARAFRIKNNPRYDKNRSFFA